MRAPLAGVASTITVASVDPDIVALRRGNVLRLGGSSGQNCDTTAPRAAISRWREAFSGGTSRLVMTPGDNFLKLLQQAPVASDDTTK